MADINDTRANIILALFDQHKKGKLVWEFADGESAQAKIGTGGLEVHIDKPRGSQSIFKIWLFKDDVKVDRFLISELQHYSPPERYPNSFLEIVSKIFKDVEAGETIDALTPFLAALKDDEGGTSQ